jgi:hypothetical protein
VNQNLQGIIFAIISLGLSVAGWLFGLQLIPSRAAAQEDGTMVPWMIIWGMIWLTTLSSLALTAFLLSGARRRSE